MSLVNKGTEKLVPDDTSPVYSPMADEHVQARMVETELQLTHEQAETIARYLRWNSVFFSPVGLQSLFPGLKPVKGK